MFFKITSQHQSKRSNKLLTSYRLGAAAVEFALVLPIFILMLSGIIEFGQAFRIEHMLSSACRRGARTAILVGTNTNQIVSSINDQCVNMLGIQSTDITVSVLVNGLQTDLAQAKTGDRIEVTVTVPYNKAAVGFFANTLASHNLSSTCVMERE